MSDNDEAGRDLAFGEQCVDGSPRCCNRRLFLQGCAVAVAAAAAHGGLVAAFPGMPAGVALGAAGPATAPGAAQAAAQGQRMRAAICHYSLRRRYAAEKWTADRLAQEVKSLGVDGIDFHARFIAGPTDDVAAEITAAVTKHGLALGSMSLSNNFNRAKAEDFKAEVQAIRTWIQFAAKVKAPVSRIFGGNLSAAERKDTVARKAAWQRMLDGLAEAAREAEKCGVVLGLENHGGLPCTAEEQVEAIKTVNSKSLRATVDVGNYLQGDQEGHVGAALAAPYAAYVHLKDYKRTADGKLVGCCLGEGDVNLAACVAALGKAGYAGFLALEYEGTEDEATAIPKCVAVMKKLLA